MRGGGGGGRGGACPLGRDLTNLLGANKQKLAEKINGEEKHMKKHNTNIREPTYSFSFYH